MAKKVKCIECENASNWSLPRKVTENNIDYAKHCLALAKRTVSCDITAKTKARNHEQYCKHFKKTEYDNSYTRAIATLEKMILEYEAQKGGGVDDNTRINQNT